jgi:hypothetical protein
MENGKSGDGEDDASSVAADESIAAPAVEVESVDVSLLLVSSF